jgi:hypothetical protein
MYVLRWFYILFFILLFLIPSCFEREHKNPIDPETPDKEIDINLSILSFDKRIELAWCKPDLINLSAIRLYRQAGQEADFILLTQLAPTQLMYSDTTANYYIKYSYYLTLVGGTNESNPSKIVSITPGPGYNWILDRWDYQLIKTTYDTEHMLKIYNLDWPPSDFAIAREAGVAVIVYVLGNLVEKYDTKQNIRLEATYEIPRPYNVIYDAPGRSFWITDSTGSLYKTGIDASGFTKIDSTLMKPLWLSVFENAGIINVIDAGSQKIMQYDRSGAFVGEITHINNKRLKGPEKYLCDEEEQRIWLVDGDNHKEYLYTKHLNDAFFAVIDSFENIGDMRLSSIDESIYLIELNGQNSQIMQLYPSTNRHFLIGNLNYPLGIAVNPYDESLLVAETYNSRVKHYNFQQNIIGILTGLNFPFKVTIE